MWEALLHLQRWWIPSETLKCGPSCPAPPWAEEHWNQVLLQERGGNSLLASPGVAQAEPQSRVPAGCCTRRVTLLSFLKPGLVLFDLHEINDLSTEGKRMCASVAFHKHIGVNCWKREIPAQFQFVLTLLAALISPGSVFFLLVLEAFSGTQNGNRTKQRIYQDGVSRGKQCQNSEGPFFQACIALCSDLLLLPVSHTVSTLLSPTSFPISVLATSAALSCLWTQAFLCLRSV